MAFTLAALALASLASVSAAPSAVDPCVKVAGRLFVPPAEALACQKSFAFNETVRRNVMTNVARVFDFFTFESYYYNSPRPFEESTSFIRAQVARIGIQPYATDYDFNRDLYDFTLQLNDGHTRWYPYCYNPYQNLLPTPIVSLKVNGSEDIYIAPDIVELINVIEPAFREYYDSIGLNYKRLAGAKVLSIEGKDPWAYVDNVAKTTSGNFLDHGIRINSVFTAYRLQGGQFSQRFGDLGGPTMRLNQNSLTFKLIPANSIKAETVTVPYLAAYSGAAFTDGPSYWAGNCAVQPDTNGVDYYAEESESRRRVPELEPVAEVVDLEATGYVLPPEYVPTAPSVNATSGVIKSYILPDNKTGVIFVGSFSPASQAAFQVDIETAVKQFKASGVTRLLIDLTNNGGGYVSLGQYLFKYLAGSGVGYPGFETTTRGNPLAQKIVTELIKRDLSGTFYTPNRWYLLNGTQMPENYNYEKPAVPALINGLYDPTSQRFHDASNTAFPSAPAQPPFDLANVAIVSNGWCASTCAMFSTLMVERAGTRVATFGGPRGGGPMEYKGMAGNQVLDWPALDSEIKTAQVKNDSAAPPDLLVNGNMRVNWRTAYSWKDKSKPIAYRSELAQLRFPYTPEIWNNPQKLWEFAATQLFA